MTDFILTAIFIPTFLLLIVLELAVFRFHKLASVARIAGVLKGYDLRDAVASLSLGLGYLAINTLWKFGVLAIFVWLFEFGQFEWDMSSPLSWIVLIVVQDFLFYWHHRAHHEVRFLWAAHVNHHSSEHYNLTTALRQSWTEQFSSWPFYIPLLFIGFTPQAILVAELLSLGYQFWVHTELLRTLGPLEWIMNTPSHHRVHHGANPQYIDKNHGGIFIVWDRLFNTFEKEVEPVRYGLTQNIDSHHLLTIAFHEWRQMIRDVKSAHNWRDRLGYVFAGPGWRPSMRSFHSQPTRSPEKRQILLLNK